MFLQTIVDFDIEQNDIFVWKDTPFIVLEWLFSFDQLFVKMFHLVSSWQWVAISSGNGLVPP